MDFDLKPVKHDECLTLKADVLRMSCENRVRALSLKYNISDEDVSLLVDGIANYLNQLIEEAYTSPLHGRR